MQYDLSKPLDKERFKARCNTLYKKGCVVEMTERTFRTGQQNSYLHLLIGVVAMETGVTLDYAKREYFKILVNREIFVRKITDSLAGEIEIVRSSAELTTEEMTMAIDRFKRWGAENGIYLPNPEDRELLHDIEVEMGRNKAYL